MFLATLLMHTCRAVTSPEAGESPTLRNLRLRGQTVLRDINGTPARVDPALLSQEEISVRLHALEQLRAELLRRNTRAMERQTVEISLADALPPVQQIRNDVYIDDLSLGDWDGDSESDLASGGQAPRHLNVDRETQGLSLPIATAAEAYQRWRRLGKDARMASKFVHEAQQQTGDRWYTTQHWLYHSEPALHTDGHRVAGLFSPTTLPTTTGTPSPPGLSRQVTPESEPTPIEDREIIRGERSIAEFLETECFKGEYQNRCISNFRTTPTQGHVALLYPKQSIPEESRTFVRPDSPLPAYIMSMTSRTGEEQRCACDLQNPLP